MRSFILSGLLVLLLGGVCQGQSDSAFHNCWSFLKSASELDQVQQFIQSENTLSSLVGAKLPGFYLKTIKGAEYSNPILKGKVVVLNFWYTTCKPCIAEMPDLNKLKRKYRKDNVVFLAIGLDEVKKINRFLRKRKFKYEHVADAQRKGFPDLFCLCSGYPMNMVVDQKGVVRYVNAGGGIRGVTNPLKFMDKMIQRLIWFGGR